MAEVTIIGMAELQRKLQQLDYTVQQDVLLEACNAGAQIVLDDAKSRAPRDSGDLADNMTKKVATRQSDSHEVTVQVGPNRKQWYGRFVERGTKYITAHAFLLPALENNRSRIENAIKAVLIRAIERAAR